MSIEILPKFFFILVSLIFLCLSALAINNASSNGALASERINKLFEKIKLQSVEFD